MILVFFRNELTYLLGKLKILRRCSIGTLVLGTQKDSRTSDWLLGSIKCVISGHPVVSQRWYQIIVI